MSFIRTKDGIYEVVGFDNECIIPSKLIKVKTNGRERITHCCDNDIIKQADTIEELCDGFYIDTEDYFVGLWIYDFNFETFKEDLDNFYNVVGYGFIKTDKGLIYVAKMNEDGELCLI